MTEPVTISTLDGMWTLAQWSTKNEPPDPFTLPKLDELDWIPATVPGAVQYDLVVAGRLDNPLSSLRAAQDSVWVSDADWLYRTTFQLTETHLVEPMAIELDGVDTFSDVWVNGALVGRTANNYRSYRFGLDPDLLRAGANELVIHLNPHSRSIAAMIPEAERRMALTGNSVHASKSLIRRYQRSFLSNNSNMLNMKAEVMGIGVNRPGRIVTVAPVELVDLHVQTMQAATGTADVRVSFRLAGSTPLSTSLAVTASLVDEETDAVVASATAQGGAEPTFVDLHVADPKLWWPNGYGAPTLYRLRVEVRDGGAVLAPTELRVGIKTVRIEHVLDNGRKTFQFVVNDTPIYVRGFNPVPVDYIKVHGEDVDYERMLDLAVDAHANLIRLWGGGAIESERFYEICDERGLMLWNDFYMHSAMYPDYDAAWTEEFRGECEDLIRRLRNHACLSILCGGNEQQQGWEEWAWQADVEKFYGAELIDQLLPGIVKQLCPEIPYIPNTPYGEPRANTPGDGVLHLGNNFFNATHDPVFVTETCWNYQSYSRPETLLKSMDLNVTEYADRGWPEKWRSVTAVPLITKFPFSGAPAAATLEQYLYHLEVEHLEADHQGLQWLRLRSPSCTGIVYWSFNKGAPLFEFGCIDYDNRPLMNFYVVKRLFADVAVDLYRDLDDIRIVGSNVTGATVAGTLRTRHLDSAGTVLRSWESPVELPPGQTTRLADLTGHYRDVVDRTRELVRTELVVGEQVVSEGTVFFCPLLDFRAESSLAAESCQLDRRTWQIDLSATGVVKLVQVEGDQRWVFSDNYFPLVPGSPRRIIARIQGDPPSEPIELTVSGMNGGPAQTVKLT